VGGEIASMIKGLLWRAAHFGFYIIPEADVGVRGIDHEDLPVVDGNRLAARFLLPVFELGGLLLACSMAGAGLELTRIDCGVIFGVVRLFN